MERRSGGRRTLTISELEIFRAGDGRSAELPAELGTPVAEVVAFLERVGVSYPLLLGGDRVHDTYARGSIPAVVVLDGAGRHVGVAIGYLDELTESHLRELIREALATSETCRDSA